MASLTLHMKKKVHTAPFVCEKEDCDTAMWTMKSLEIHTELQHSTGSATCVDSDDAEGVITTISVLPLAPPLDDPDCTLAEEGGEKLEEEKTLDAPDCTLAEEGGAGGEKHDIEEEKKCERPFVCEEKGCVFAGKTSGTLKSHVTRRHKSVAASMESGGGGGGGRKGGAAEGQMVESGAGTAAVRTYVCDEKDCDYTATCRSHILAHQRGHSGERLFICQEDDCDFAAMNNGGLAKHMRGHLGLDSISSSGADVLCHWDRHRVLEEGRKNRQILALQCVVCSTAYCQSCIANRFTSKDDEIANLNEWEATKRYWVCFVCSGECNCSGKGKHYYGRVSTRPTGDMSRHRHAHPSLTVNQVLMTIDGMKESYSIAAGFPGDEEGRFPYFKTGERHVGVLDAKRVRELKAVYPEIVRLWVQVSFSMLCTKCISTID